MEIEKSEPIVIWGIQDHHDERYFLYSVYEMAGEGGAHIRRLGDWFVISHKPLSGWQAERAVRRDQREQAREALKDGVAPYEVWGSFYVSAKSVSELLREEGIQADKRWFSKGQKTEAQPKTIMAVCDPWWDELEAAQ